MTFNGSILLIMLIRLIGDALVDFNDGILRNIVL